MKRQVFVHAAAPLKELFQPVANQPAFVKPRGGLWTSAYSPEYVSGWVRWCAGEHFGPSVVQGWLLTPDPQAQVYVIDGHADMMRLYERYGRETWGRPWLDWERIAGDFDAVSLTEEGQWETRLSYPYNLYGWDCESTLWLRWAFTVVEPLGEIRVYEVEEQAA